MTHDYEAVIKRWKERSSFDKLKQYGLKFSDYEAIKSALQLAIDGGGQ